MFLSKLSDFRFKRLRIFASAIGARYLGVYLFEAVMTILILKNLEVVTLAQYAMVLGIFSLVECLSFSVIDKVLFKRFRPGIKYFAPIYKIKLFANLFIFATAFALLIFLEDPIFSTVSVSPIDDWSQIIFFFTVYFFLISTNHPVVAVGPIYRISFPYLFVAVGNKFFPLLFFSASVLNNNASLYSLSASLFFGALIVYPINIFLFAKFHRRQKQRIGNQNIYHLKLRFLIDFWAKNIPNNFLNSLETRGIYLVLGLILSEVDLATYFAISRITNMLLFGRSLLKQASMFLLSGLSIEWFINQFFNKYYITVAYLGLSVITLAIGFILLGYLAPSTLASSEEMACFAIFSMVPFFYINPILRALLTVHLRVADLFIGSLVKNIVFFIFVMFCAWISQYKLEVALLGVAASMAVFSIWNLGLIRYRRVYGDF